MIKKGRYKLNMKARMKRNYKAFLHLLLCLFTVFFILCIFGPVYISRNNGTILNAALLRKIGIGGGGICFILSIPALVWGESKYVEGVINGVLLLVFINSTIIPFRATILDGREFTTVETDIFPIIRNVIMFCFLTFLGYRLRKQLKFIAIPLLAVCMVITFYNPSTARATGESETITTHPTLTKEEIMKSAGTFSTDKNVIVIVIDMLQGTTMEKVFNKYPETSNTFEGFTIYTRAFSSFPYTTFSRPVIWSGNEYSTESTYFYDGWIAASKNSIFTDLEKAGFHNTILGVRAEGQSPYQIERVDSVMSDANYLYGFALAASIARITGYWPSNPFFGDAIKMAIDMKVSTIPIYNMLFENLSVKSEDMRSLFIWDYTLHGPIALTQDGETYEPVLYVDENSFIEEFVFEFSQLDTLFSYLKENNIYDDSLIVVVGDHGHPVSEIAANYDDIEDFSNGYETYGNQKAIGVYNVALCVKPPYAKGSAQITHDDAWNGDIRAIVDYYIKNFEYKDPLEVIANIREEKPIVGVLYSPGYVHEDQTSSASHQTVEVSSLYDIAPAFEAMQNK